MPPKPFPYPLGIGTDICHIPRIHRIIHRKDEAGLERFGAKIFNAFEHQIFLTKLRRYRADRSAAVAQMFGPDGPPKRSLEVAEEGPLKAFSHWIAGRFAAKEAAIKAVGPRRLFYHDVTILIPPKESGKAPYARIEPPRRTVKIPHLVAARRGIHLPPGAEFVLRPKLASAEERQIAKLSISHDGEYATAVVLAVGQEVESKDNIVDLGREGPLHEPSIEDELGKMYDWQLNWLVRNGKLKPVGEGEGEGEEGVRVESPSRQELLRQELERRGLPTELDARTVAVLES